VDATENVAGCAPISRLDLTDAGSFGVGSTLAEPVIRPTACRRLQPGAEESELEALARRVVGRRQKVPVAVEGDLDARVPELLRDQLRMLAVGDQEARERVPQVMEADLGQARSPRLRCRASPPPPSSSGSSASVSTRSSGDSGGVPSSTPTTASFQAAFALADLLSLRGHERLCETLVAWARSA
jgi:hypothetical protein